MNPVDAALGELKKFPIFEHLNNQEILELCHGAQIIATSNRQTIIKHGFEASYFGVVLGGAYKLTKPSPSGEDVIMYFATPGDVLAAFVMGPGPHSFPISAVSMGPSRFLKIPKENFHQLWKQNSELIYKIQTLMMNRMDFLQRQKLLTKAPLQQKVASLLIDLLNKDQTSVDMILPIPLTRKEIAENLGASVESVIRIMSDWSKQEIIKTTDQQITICKPEVLIRLMDQTE